MGSDRGSWLPSGLCDGFNSRSRMGSDRYLPQLFQTWPVSIRAPAWGATTTYHHSTSNQQVSIRAPAWGATMLRGIGLANVDVSIRAPAWGATLIHFQTGRTKSVSIRAPAWGATHCGINRALASSVSIRAPAWGATQQREGEEKTAKFQFALPHGERRQVAFFRGSRGVSIRAPAWGATLWIRCRGRHIWFQFALPHGERQNRNRATAVGGSFNSRSRMGSDAILAEVEEAAVCFNSRSRMGSDLAYEKLVRYQTGFQFALPHGERHGG